MWDCPWTPVPGMFILWAEGENQETDVAIYNIHISRVT